MPFPLVNQSYVLVDKVQNIIVSVNVMSLYTINPLVVLFLQLWVLPAICKEGCAQLNIAKWG